MIHISQVIWSLIKYFYIEQNVKQIAKRIINVEESLIEGWNRSTVITTAKEDRYKAIHPTIHPTIHPLVGHQS